MSLLREIVEELRRNRHLQLGVLLLSASLLLAFLSLTSEYASTEGSQRILVSGEVEGWVLDLSKDLNGIKVMYTIVTLEANDSMSVSLDVVGESSAQHELDLSPDEPCTLNVTWQVSYLNITARSLRPVELLVSWSFHGYRRPMLWLSVVAALLSMVGTALSIIGLVRVIMRGL